MKRAWVVILCGAAVVTLAMGVRQSFGLLLPAMSDEIGITRGAFGLALAIQNLIFGMVQPFVGALADKHGAGRVTVFGAALYAAGLIAASFVDSALGLHLSLGVAVGMALSATTFVTVLGVVGRVVAPVQRSLAFGMVTAGGSLGQFLLVPIGQWLISDLGYREALIALGAIILMIVPLAIGLAGKPIHKATEESKAQSLSSALRGAAGSKAYWLLNLGFFVCGFHIAFLATHFPAYLNDKGLGLGIGATTLALIGLFNIFGSYFFGAVGGRFPKKWILASLYAARGLTLVVFLAFPLSTTSALIFASTMGFLWLGTVPLTSGLVGELFGMRYLSTMYGIVYLSHQIGSFFGAWASGYIFDLKGNYDSVWAVAIGLAFVAALAHVPIKSGLVAQPRTA